MLTYAPKTIQTLADLPPAGRLQPAAQERGWLDFKITVAPNKVHEMAKDIAALANSYGGAIVIGVTDSHGVLAYSGISVAHAHTLQEAYQGAANAWCAPVPTVLPSPIIMPGSELILLAVNVAPFLGGLVGANATIESRRLDTTQRNADAWLFPVRDSSHTRYLSPKEIPLHFDGHRRAITIRLLQLDQAGQANMSLFTAPEETEPFRKLTGKSEQTGPAPLVKMGGKLLGVFPDENRVEFEVNRKHSAKWGPAVISIPLADIEDAWKDGLWCIRVRGRVQQGQENARAYVPVF